MEYIQRNYSTSSSLCCSQLSWVLVGKISFQVVLSKCHDVVKNFSSSKYEAHEQLSDLFIFYKRLKEKSNQKLFANDLLIRELFKNKTKPEFFDTHFNVND